MEDEKISPDELIAIDPIEQKSNELAKQIIAEDNVDEIKKLTDAFNLNQAKKELLRVNTYNKVIDGVTEQMAKRIEKYSDSFSNKDLIDYLSALNNSIDRAKKSNDVITNTPLIQINQVNVSNDVNSTLSRESRERVCDVVARILQNASKENTSNTNDGTEVIDVEEDSTEIDKDVEEKQEDSED